MANPQVQEGFIQMATEIQDALCRTLISGRARMVFDFIVRKTWGWGKKEDRISLSQFVEGTGISKCNIIIVRNALVRMNMIKVFKNENDRLLTYSIQKDYEKWGPFSETKKFSNPKRVVFRSEHKQFSEMKTKITKDTTTKDIITTEQGGRPLSPHQEFIKTFKDVYEERTGQPFKTDKKHFIIVASLIQKHGIEALVTKAKILAGHCQNCDKWFTKDSGWAAYSIETLSTKWNELIPQVRMSDQEIEDKSFQEELRKLKEKDARISSEINARAGM